MKNIKKYFRIFLRCLKMDVMYDMSSRISFLIMLAVELFFTLAGVIFFNILYGNIQTLVGWNYYEMLLLIGFDTVMVELLVGIVFANGSNALPGRITTGYVDYFLLKPVSSYVFLTLVHPYFPSIVSTLFGFLIMGVAFSHLTIHFTVFTIVNFIFMTCCGFIISATLMIAAASFAFKFTDAKAIPRIGMNLITNFSDRPHQIYNTVVLRVIFFFITPAVYLSSIPVFSLLHELSPYYLVSGLLLAFVFVLLSKKIWDSNITNYTSASS